MTYTRKMQVLLATVSFAVFSGMAVNPEKPEKSSVKDEPVTCGKIIWKDIFYTDTSNGESGNIQLAYINETVRLDNINELILAELGAIISNYSPMFSNEDSAEAFKGRDKLHKLISMQHEEETVVQQNSNSFVSSSVFCREDILCYEVTVDARGDKGSPYRSFINIKTEPLYKIAYSDVINPSLTAQWNRLLDSLASPRLEELIQQHLDEFSNSFGYAVARRMEDFLTENYKLVRFIALEDIPEKELITQDEYDSFQFADSGVYFQIYLEDKNDRYYYHELNLPKNDRVEYIAVNLLVPYEMIVPFTDKNSPVYSSLIQLIK